MMQEFILLLVGVLGLTGGAVFGYYVRQNIARRQLGTIEAKINHLISEAKRESQEILIKAKERAVKMLEDAKQEEGASRSRILRLQASLERREVILDQKLVSAEKREQDLTQKAEKVRQLKEELETLKGQELESLSKIAGLSSKEAKEELLTRVEKENEAEIFEKMRVLEQFSKEKIDQRAKELLALAIQRYGASQAAEITTTTVFLPDEEMKGRIIGKEGRNIKTLEKLTGVELIVDDTPEAVVVSGFDPIRRQVAKIALEKLIQDGRIQPARIEETIEKARQEITLKIREMGETAVFDAGIAGLDPKIIQLVGRLHFRTSYGQNVLLHSLEVCHLAGALASEIGGNVQVAKKAGLLHDIGKAVDHEIQGSHTEIGINILKRFGVEEEVIQAMKSHHEEYPYESLEAMLVQTADAISGARPGARKDSLENYLKRLTDLEAIATGFEGAEKAWALQAGRELRVFVKPEAISDLEAAKLAREIADRIQETLKYPGEIKVNVIRETRVTEYAR